MRLGVGFPHPDVGTDPVVIRDFVQAAEDAGFDYLSASEHVAGTDTERFSGVDTGHTSPPYPFDFPWREPFTLFAFIAGVTTRIELITRVLVLPQRQTVLVAKQAAEVSLLSGGRLQLGVGAGWNHPEFEALGADFHTRGRREAEQIVVLRKLWTEPVVSFTGQWHTLDRIGIAPLPADPIPIWIGGGVAEATLRRVAQLADGWMWMPNLRREGETAEVIARLRSYLEEAGREPSSLGINVGIGSAGEASEWVAAARHWEQLGATHLGLTGGGRGSDQTPMQQLERAVEVKRVLALELGY